MTCKGLKTNIHTFLAGEGCHSSCEKCGSCICRFCRLGQLCLECAQDSIFGPNLTNHAQPESIMRQALGLKGVAIPQKAAYVDVLQLYEQEQEGVYDLFENELDNVKSPMLPSKSLLPSAGQFEIVKPTIMVGNLCDVILDSSIELNVGLEFLNILTSIAYVEHRPAGKKISYEYIVAKTIVEMANNSRVHEGHRLCYRAVRHAEDTGNPDILIAKMVLAKHNGRLCIIITSDILASMRAIQYKGATAFESSNIIATTCRCKAGGDNEEVGGMRGDKKVVCTHTIARLVQLSHLFYRDDRKMTKSLLCALHSRLRKEGEKEWENQLSNVEKRQFFNNVSTLIRITGSQPPIGNMGIRTTMDLLANYSVTTDTAQMGPAGKACIRDLGLLREKLPNFCTPLISAEQLFKQEQLVQEEGDGETKPIKNIPLGTCRPGEYAQNQVAVEAVAVFF